MTTPQASTLSLHTTTTVATTHDTRCTANTEHASTLSLHTTATHHSSSCTKSLRVGATVQAGHSRYRHVRSDVSNTADARAAGSLGAAGSLT